MFKVKDAVELSLVFFGRFPNMSRVNTKGFGRVVEVINGKYKVEVGGERKIALVDEMTLIKEEEAK